VYCGDDEYIGSTTRPLSERMSKHRTAFKGGGIGRCSSIKTLFDKHGIENCKIELIEDYPCERKEQLDKREGEIQRERTCVNMKIAGRTKAEYYLDNKEELNGKMKQYQLENKDRINEQRRQRHLNKKSKQI
jgi:hypothetical protein